jgi:hypothetical protein
VLAEELGLVEGGPFAHGPRVEEGRFGFTIVPADLHGDSVPFSLPSVRPRRAR